MFCITLCGPRTKKFGDPGIEPQTEIAMLRKKTSIVTVKDTWECFVRNFIRKQRNCQDVGVT